MWGKFGVCSEPYPTVLRAELHALVEILRVTVGPITIFVDNLEVVNGIPNGERWCCHPKRDGADLWKQIWHRLRELEGMVRVEKVKAHLTYQHVLDGRMSWAAWIGNGIADLWAKRGCAEASRLSPADWAHSEWSKACAVYTWAACIAAEWITDTQTTSIPADPPTPARAIKVKTKRKYRPPSTHHEIWRTKNNGWCRLCGIHGPWTRRARPTIFARPCAGTMGTRCAIVGRERAVSTDKAAFDDGAIAMTTLFAFGAEKAYACDDGSVSAPVPAGPAGGHAAGHQDDRQEGVMRAQTTSSTSGRLQSTSFAPAVNHASQTIEDEEGDPFGHGPLGFDEPFTSVRLAEPAPGMSASTSGGVQRPPGAHSSHSLRRTGNIVWCAICGRHAAIRLGIGLIKPCRGVAIGGYPSRIARLKVGRHPVTGSQI